MQVDIRVQLLVAAAPGEFVVCGDTLPEKPAGAAGADYDAATLFRKVVGTDPRMWSAVRQVRYVDITAARKVVLYAVEVPEKFALGEGMEWVPAARLVNDMEATEAAAMAQLAYRYMKV